MPDETAPQPDKTTLTENETPAIETPLPAEYEQGELPKHFLHSVPQHFHVGLRPSAMPLASEDSFSRRITPLGVYYPKDRYRQERQFASAVMELMEKKAFERKNDVVDAVHLPPSDVVDAVHLPPSDAKLTVTVSEKEPSKEQSKESPTDSSKEPSNETPSNPNPPSKDTQKDTQKDPSKDTQKDTQRERRVSIIDQIKPPPASLKPLRIINPDSIPAQDEDYRADKTAPRTPANVRGNRSALHKVGGIFVIPRIGHINVRGRNTGFF